MTEFELVPLELMKEAHRSDLIELVFASINLIANDVGSFITLLCGYLLTAYFLVSNLTKA